MSTARSPILDEALATCERIGHRAFEAELHRVRGEMLLERDPANPAPAEEAFQTAIAVAKRQGTRSFELRAALSLAKLYQSTGRAADAHAVLAPALEGFSPTPEMPEIAEAQALLTALAATDEVKAEAAHRQRLTQLHVSYGNALIAARGYGAPETTEAFAKARESASGDKDAPERLAADYGLWVGSYVRGELAVDASARRGLPQRRRGETRFARSQRRPPRRRDHLLVRRRVREARDHLERALALFQPGRDDDLAFRFGQDAGVVAMTFLALALWPLGDVDRAISLIDRMQTRMAGLAHVGTLALGRMHAAMFELMRGDHTRAPRRTSSNSPASRASMICPCGARSACFSRAGRPLRAARSATGSRTCVAASKLAREQNVLMFDGPCKIALAEAEARAGDPDRAVAILDEALATGDRIGYRTFEAELHRARGEILLKRDPANPAPAEDAFLTAIAVAKQQGTRSFELRAALALAKLYQSTARPADAHAVLGFETPGCACSGGQG